MDQLAQVGRIVSELDAAGVRYELGARSVRRVIELLSGPVAAKVLGVLLGKKSALVMIKPPSHLGGAAVFEIDDGIFLGLEHALVEELLGAVHQSAQNELRVGLKLSAIEIPEDRGGASAVKATIVVEETYLHGQKTN
jgi:hypothetical protein